jgi:heme/copper-type cytochrome/quinol oxidase subunit 2
MREVMLIIHFTGLALTLGMSFSLLFLKSTRMLSSDHESRAFAMRLFALHKMSHIGITLLILSGGYLMTPYWSALGNMPLMTAKLALVIVLILWLIMLSVSARKARKTPSVGNLSRVSLSGWLMLLTTLAIVVLAVLSWN